MLAELLLVDGCWFDLPVAYDADVEDFAGHCDVMLCCGIIRGEYGRVEELWVLDVVCQRKLKFVEEKMSIYISAIRLYIIQLTCNSTS